MTDSCMEFAKRETEKLEKEMEELQEKIRLHNETKDAWDTILRNAGEDSQAKYLDLANSEKERLNGEIEAVRIEIRRHIESREAWESILRTDVSEPRVLEGVKYVKDEDVQWHLQRLEMEIDDLQARIRLRDEIKAAWEIILRNASSESHSSYLDLANAETGRLNKEIEAVQLEIRRRDETRSAWDTILRNAVNEAHVYKGATYLKGWDGQWHIQQAQDNGEQVPAIALQTQASEAVENDDRKWASNAVSKVQSVRNALLDACERTLLSSPKRTSIPGPGKEQLQSLGLS